MSVLAWVYLAVALLGSFAAGVLAASSWNRRRKELAMEALVDRPRLVDELNEARRSRDAFLALAERDRKLIDKYEESNRQLRARLEQTAWAVHSWRSGSGERGQA